MHESRKINTGVHIRKSSTWFPGLDFHSDACMRLFAFPFAGGDVTAFKRWNNWLPSEVELLCVQLPERGIRQSESIPDNLSDLVDQLLPAIIPLLDRPCIFFGYSMGGIIAYAIIMRLIQQGMRCPELLCVAACNPPHHHRFSWDTMSDETLIDTLTNSDSSWVDYIAKNMIQNNLNLIRKDLLLCQDFLKKNESASVLFDCPIATFCGEQDSIATNEEIFDWRRYTSASCVSHNLPGGHFFLLDSMSNQLARLLLRELRSIERKLSNQTLDSNSELRLVRS